MTPSSEESPWSKGAGLDLVMGQAFYDWINWDATTRQAMTERAFANT